MMEKQRNTFVSKNGKTKVNYYEWSNGEKPKAILQIAHGVTEYAERYTKLAEYLSDKGIMVIANDHIGHGYSQNEDGSNKMCFGAEGSWDSFLFFPCEETNETEPWQTEPEDASWPHCDFACYQ